MQTAIEIAQKTHGRTAPATDATQNVAATRSSAVFRHRG